MSKNVNMSYQAAAPGSRKGLLSGGMFESRLAESISRSTGTPFAVLVFGLNRFRRVNHLLGYGAGDRALALVARRLKHWLPAKALACHLGGDEFAVVARVRGEREARQLAEQVIQLLDKPISVDCHEFQFTASLGLSLYPADGATPGLLLRRAAAAMQQAKHCGGNAIERNNGGERLYAEERFRLEQALRLAMLHDELSLRYQPQVDRRGVLKAVEALIEWNSAELGRVETETFIRLAEETGAILEIGTWVLDRACRQLAEWHRSGYDAPRVAVNVSPQQFSSPVFVDMVRQTIERNGIEGRLLELEITERSILRDVAESARRMEELRALGVRIAVDDFGVGYSPLSYLHTLPLDVVKVDRSFIRQITKPCGSLPVVHTITVLAHHRGLEVVAEGVETEGELELVRAARCDLVQGYLIGLPMSAVDLAGLMAAPERLAVHTQARAASSY